MIKAAMIGQSNGSGWISYQSGRTGRVVWLAMGVRHQNLDFVASQVPRLHVRPDDGLHQLAFVGEFLRQ